MRISRLAAVLLAMVAPLSVVATSHVGTSDAKPAFSNRVIFIRHAEKGFVPADGAAPETVFVDNEQHVFAARPASPAGAGEREGDPQKGHPHNHGHKDRNGAGDNGRRYPPPPHLRGDRKAAPNGDWPPPSPPGGDWPPPPPPGHEGDWPPPGGPRGPGGPGGPRGPDGKRKFPSGLNDKGRKRAQFIRTVFGNESEYNVGMIFAAPRDSDVKETERTYATVMPLAADLGLEINIDCAMESWPFSCVVEQVHKFAATSEADILVSWKHRNLNEIATALGAPNAKIHYPDERNDIIWIMHNGRIVEKRSMHCPDLDDGRVDEGDPDLEVEA